AVVLGGTRIELQRVLAVTPILQLFLAADMLSTGLGRLEAMGVLPQSPTVWDTSFALADHGFIGGFLGGLIGYRARPSLLEVGGYLVYVIVARAMLFRSGPAAPRSRPTGRRGPAHIS